MSMVDLERSFRFYRGRQMSEVERAAAKRLVPVPAPLGLTEWRTTGGQVYAKGANAVDVQVGLDARNPQNAS